MVRTRKCHLCGKFENVQLHRFPTKDRLTLFKWLAICQLAPEEVRTHSKFVCSDHFDVQQYRSHRLYHLNDGAVPSINIPMRPALAISVSTAENLHYLSSITVPTPEIKVEMDDLVEKDESSSSTSGDSTTLYKFSQSVMAVPCADHDYPRKQNKTAQVKKGLCRHRLRSNFDVQQVCLSDFSNPKKAQRILAAIKEEDRRKTEEIKRLRQLRLF